MFSIFRELQNALIDLIAVSCHNRKYFCKLLFYNYLILSSESSAPLRSQGQTGGHLLANLPPCKKTSEAYSRIIEESLPSIVTRKENGKMMSKRTNVALQSLLETGKLSFNICNCML